MRVCVTRGLHSHDNDRKDKGQRPSLPPLPRITIDDIVWVSDTDGVDNVVWVSGGAFCY